MIVSPNRAPIREARRRAASDRPTSEPGMCLREVRECYGIGPRAEDAAEAWRDADRKHPETDPHRIPRGAAVFWTGGSGGHGHVAIATGFAGKCFSTDIRRPGYFDQVPIAEIADKWGLKLVGWAADLNGVRVWAPDTPDKREDAEPKPAKKTSAAKKTAAKKTGAKR